MHFRGGFPTQLPGGWLREWGPWDRTRFSSVPSHEEAPMFSQIIFQKAAIFHVVAVQQTGFQHTDVLLAQSARSVRAGVNCKMIEWRVHKKKKYSRSYKFISWVEKKLGAYSVSAIQALCKCLRTSNWRRPCFEVFHILAIYQGKKSKPQESIKA